MRAYERAFSVQSENEGRLPLGVLAFLDARRFDEARRRPPKPTRAIVGDRRRYWKLSAMPRFGGLVAGSNRYHVITPLRTRDRAVSDPFILTIGEYMFV